MQESVQVKKDVDEIYIKSVLDIGIPPRPMILDILARELKRTDPDFACIVRAINDDVSLSAGMIKTVNSPYFGFRTRARSVQQAVVMLGLNATAKAIAGVALRNIFPPTPALERFWDASACIAEFSGYLVNEIGIKDGIQSEDAHTYGLFRDCGMPVLMRKFPDYFKTLARANDEKVLRFTEIEDMTMPTNHAVVGCMLAQNWSLPEEICLAIRHHHDIVLMRTGAESLPRGSRRLIALGQLAERIHQQHTGLAQGHEWDKLGESSLKELGLAAEEMELLVGRVIAASVGH